jgi:hypothetical protein
MAKRYKPKEPHTIYNELATVESARVAIILAASMLEYTLEGTIQFHLREPSNQKERDALFNDNGLIGSFYQKIWMAERRHAFRCSSGQAF